VKLDAINIDFVGFEKKEGLSELIVSEDNIRLET
jgi:hypothetical protein